MTESSLYDSAGVLAQMRQLLAAGEVEAAGRALASFASRDLNDADLHFDLARLAEEVGDVSRAVLEYNFVLRDNPDRPDALRRLGHLRADQGHFERSLRCFKRLLVLCPDDAEAAAECERLSALLERGAGTEIDRAISPSQTGPGLSTESTPWAGELRPSEADAINLASRFAGREGVYARQWAARDQRSGYSPVHEPFTPVIARKHLLGEITVGIYPVRLDQTVTFMAFDLDIARFAFGRATGDSRAWLRIQRTVQDAALAIVRTCRTLGLAAYIEDSGQKGRHVWLFFGSPVPAIAARRLGMLILDESGPLPHEVTVELFPKQARVTGDGLGNLIKLPLGIHRQTGRRAVFLGEDGEPVSDQLHYLGHLKTVPRERVLSLLSGGGLADSPDGGADGGTDGGRSGKIRGRRTAGVPGVVEFEDAAARIADKPHDPGDPGMASAVAGPAYDYHDDPEWLWLTRGCGVLAEIARRAETTHVLSANERAVLTYTVGHLTNGPGAVNAILGQTLSVEPGEFLKSRLRGNPMSCPKIRSRLPEIAASVDCACQFAPDAGAYPSPLLHLHELRLRHGSQVRPGTSSQLQLERMVADLLRIRADVNRLQRLASALERELVAVMTEQDLSEIRTLSGTVTRSSDGTLRVSVDLGKGAGEHPVRD